MSKKQQYVVVKQVRSTAKCPPTHKATIKGLGLGRINKVVKLKNDPCIMGMVNKVGYLLSVEYA